ncbi:inositol monophosphatase family protein [Brevundimonas sp. 2R-24]|uniref:Inositol monophosphatase family protein n=1 Tax=Peiella sedimenti TaxID=3061083 RepID=A0ABT8SJ10_9CAUL|nr:inositol monophosphatase family protein [Caulobacteraceae bacterium XZ-24]
MSSLTAFEAFALELVAVAATETLPPFRQEIAIVDKGAQRAFDPVTAADRGAEAALRRAIANRFPDHGVIGEEYGEDRPHADWVWVLDPIDGTRAYIAGLPLWTTLIALMREGEPVLGVVAQPYLQETFVGTRSASRLVRPGQPDRTLRTRPCPTLADATISTTDPALFADEEAAAWRGLRQSARLARLGCDAYAYAMLAAGQIDVVLESGLKLWDWAAHKPLIEGAGGQVEGWISADCGPGQILATGDARLQTQVRALLG